MGAPKKARMVAVPTDWYMAGDGIRVRNDSEWIYLILNEDGSVVWHDKDEIIRALREPDGETL